MENLLPYNDDIEVYTEVYNIKEELSNLCDESLVDEVTDLVIKETFGPVVDYDIKAFLNNGKLTKDERKRLEGCYILYHTTSMLGEDGQIRYVLVR